MSCSKNFTAGNIAKHINAWKALTSDEQILSIVMGCQLEFVQPPCQTKVPGVTNVSSREAQIFTRPKNDGCHRLILNLKRFNEYIVYHHFKMDSLQSAVQLMKPNCWMAVLDLKDAYYSVPIATEDRKYLRFEHEG